MIPGEQILPLVLHLPEGVGLSASSEPPEQEAKQGAGCLGKWDRQLSCWLFQTFAAPSFDDKILEVVAVFGSMQMAVSRVIKLQHHRIAQVLAVLLQRSSPSPSGVTHPCLERQGLA